MYNVNKAKARRREVKEATQQLPPLGHKPVYVPPVANPKRVRKNAV